MKHFLPRYPKLSIVILGCILVFLSVPGYAQFPDNPIHWGTPKGGEILIDTSSSLALGFNQFGGSIESYSYLNSIDNGSQSWSLIDMNGDGKPDLVVTSALVSNFVTQFGIDSNPYWKVYLNTGGEFSPTPTNWPTPHGGEIYFTGHNSYRLGFTYVAGQPYSNDTAGTEGYSLVDMNGDGKPDLVITESSQADGNLIQLGAGINPHWLVYMNNGAGFSDSAITWNTPQGGGIGNGIAGFNYVTGEAAYEESMSQTWSLFDINGDGKPDLVVTSSLVISNSSVATEFGAGANPYWKVYLNTGSSFSSTVTSWYTPQGGNKGPDTTWNGFNDVQGGPGELGGESWSLVDMNGDGKPDLVVTASDSSYINAQFGADGDPYWKIYFNMGSGFSDTAINWSTPQGGEIYYTDSAERKLGFYTIKDTTTGIIGTDEKQGSQSWDLIDLNGDGRPDLVVSGFLDTSSGRDLIQFGADSIPYWQVFLNNGNGFSSTGFIWTTPIGGQVAIGVTNYNMTYQLGFNCANGPESFDSRFGSQYWKLTDMNGDGKPDLVVMSYYDSLEDYAQFAAGSNPYWQVYINNTTLEGISEEDTLTEQFKLYPNPAKNYVIVETDESAIGATVQISDITWRELNKLQITNSKYQIPISALASGVYFVRVSDNNGRSAVKKLVIE